MAGRSHFGRIIAPILGICLASLSAAQNFTADEIERIRDFWSGADRYSVDVPKSSMKSGIWQVRLTVAGSQWFWNYNKVRGLGKVNPNVIATPQTPDQVEWEKWIDAKVALDRRKARKAADELNASVLPGYVSDKSPLPEDPGAAPVALLALAGNPPSFAEAAIPIEHTIKFDDGLELKYVDHVAMKPKYAYYRFEKGVISGGAKVRDLPKNEVASIFEAAGLDETERKVMAAVSLLEGGFDSVNTYDTGFVSVGLIQFASLKDGAGSLGRLMKRLKASDPESFESAFRRFGIDATDDGRLVALDLDTGAEVLGPEANLRIIEDRRLIAVFQRAGLKCKEFRVAQLQSAIQDYYPSEDSISFQANGKAVALKVSDIIRSEAGLATLMDRKVNTGVLDPLTFVVSLIASENGIWKAEDLQKYERDIIIALKYRKDYLADSTLTQPGKAMQPERNYSVASRKGTGRSGRGGSKGGSSGGNRGRS